MELSGQQKATVRAAMEGNQEAFEKVVNQFARLVYTQSFSILQDRQEAEDVTQEAFLRAYRYRVRLQNPDRFPQWLMAIARNAARDRLRKHRPDRDVGNRIQVLADNHRSPLGWAEVTDDIDRLNQALQALPRHYREILRLRYIEGLDHRSIRQQLGVSEGALRGVLARALNRLRRVMGVD